VSAAASASFSTLLSGWLTGTRVTAGWLLVATKLAACVPRRGWQFEPERVNNRRIRTKPWGERWPPAGRNPGR
jgi:hypothetical protein